MLVVAKLPPKKSKAPSGKSTSVYVGNEVWQRLDQIAAERGYKSRSSLVTGILEQWVAEYDEGKIEEPRQA